MSWFRQKWNLFIEHVLVILKTDVYETIAVDSYKRKIPNEVLECYKCSSMWWIQTKQGSKRWLGSLYLCLYSSRGYKRNKKSVNIALHRKQATLTYWVMKRLMVPKTISSQRQLEKLKNLSKKMNIRRFHFRKIVLCTSKEGY